MSEPDNMTSTSDSEPLTGAGQPPAGTNSADNTGAGDGQSAAAASSDDAAGAAAQGDQSSADDNSDREVTSGPSAVSAQDAAIYDIRLLTAVVVGSVVEGGDQLLSRLKQYEAELQTKSGAANDGQAAVDEDELDRLRYAVVGLIFDTQNMIGRSIALTAQLTETTLDVTNAVSKPFRNFFLFRPVTKRVEKRVDGMVERGQDSLSRWINLGRQLEPESRRLATMTYGEIVDEFISRLADNPELHELVAQQSLSLAAGVRDEVRERTVTSDNVLEGIARRILRREPRHDLPAPPPEVQRWAGITPDELKEMEDTAADEQQSDSAK